MRCGSRSRSLFSSAFICCSPTTISRKPRTAFYSSRRILISAMAESNGNLSSDATDEVKFGFQRPEMYQNNLAGTVDAYGRHLFLCYGTHDSWPSRVENSDTDLLPKLLSAALKARKDDFNVKTRLTICEGNDGTVLSDGDILIFPEMIKYRGLKDSDVDGFVEDVLVNGKPWASGVQELLTGSHVFVCAHNNRDRRCGVCGPALIEKFKEEIESRDLKDQVFVAACSHVGGHKYAGNIIIVGANSEGQIAGHWYGYVTPNDVSELLDQHISKGELIERIWRGQMTAHVEEAENVELKIPNGNDQNSCDDPQENASKEEEEENVGGCCQGANGFSCCRDRNAEAILGDNASGRSKTWMRTLEGHEVVAAVAVVGALAAVAVACSFYRRSR